MQVIVAAKNKRTHKNKLVIVLAGDDPPDLFAFIAAKNNFEAGSWNEAFASV
jgi:hypothetical protein